MGANADVLVIGAGMAGVTAARELAREGFGVIVVEGGARGGGRSGAARCGTRVALAVAAAVGRDGRGARADGLDALCGWRRA